VQTKQCYDITVVSSSGRASTWSDGGLAKVQNLWQQGAILAAMMF